MIVELSEKTRSEIGGDKILPGFLELGQVFYMVEIVVSSSIIFMLWVFDFKQSTERTGFKVRSARVWSLARGQGRRPLGWAWLVATFCTPMLAFHTPGPISCIFVIFAFLFHFWLWLFISKYKKCLQIFSLFFLHLFWHFISFF